MPYGCKTADETARFIIAELSDKNIMGLAWDVKKQEFIVSPPNDKLTHGDPRCQSSVMSLMAARGEITPVPKAAIFADTQAEPAAVMKWLDWLETQLPFPIIRVQKAV